MGGVGSSSIALNVDGLVDSVDDLAIFELSDLDRKPHALFQTEPTYLYSLKLQKVEGWVIIEWIITDAGRVTHPRVIQSLHREFQQPAIDSISSSKWKPGEISGKAGNSRVRQKITFSL
jgi:protein TonB|tara:strand:+ start:2953 stop:3309 length:357 start_codon:yes stop_codon:yes gene_type:complete